MRVATVEDPLLTAQSMIEHGEVNIYDLWLQYYASGGNSPKFEFEAFLNGANQPSALDLYLLGLSIEELRTPAEPLEPRR